MHYTEALKPNNNEWKFITEAIYGSRAVSYQYTNGSIIMVSSIDVLHGCCYYHVTLACLTKEAQHIANDVIHKILKDLIPDSVIGDWDESFVLNPFNRSFWYLVDPFQRKIREQNNSKPNNVENNVVPFKTKIIELKERNLDETANK